MNSTKQRQTVRELNGVIQLNMALSKHCDWALTHLSDAALKQTLSDLKRLHDKHIDRVSESVRLLGGAPPEERRDVPVELEEQAVPRKGDQGVVSSIYADEEKLQRMYHEHLISLSANTDLVDVLSEAMDEIDAKSETLRLYAKLRAGG